MDGDAKFRAPRSRLGPLESSIDGPEASSSAKQQKLSRSLGAAKKVSTRPELPQSPTKPQNPKRAPNCMRATTGSLPAVPKLERRPRKSDEYRTDNGIGTPNRSSTTGIVPNGDYGYDGDDVLDTVKVLVRVRPPTAAELADGVVVDKTSSRTVCLKQIGHEAQEWRFDYVADGAISQQEMFQVAGQPIVEHCIAGYNSSIFAYGQTGAGKTHTMQGSLTDPEQRGLSLRVFEWLFKRIAEEEAAAGRDNLKYSCKCSFLEIYNESITDLLKPTAATLQLREDVTRGCFVDGLSEEIVLNAEDAADLIRKGAQNRKIGQTKMNHESSRSHSVFTCTIESTVSSHAGIAQIRFSRLNLVDLAGSERNKSSGATGEHFKEACSINGSLTALGRVIMELVEAQRTKRQGHIPYRDSKLTFLLQDSLGGNAKSMIIANVSPAATACNETISTLQFVSRAKQIRNKAVVNQDTQAMSMEVLKRELQRAYRELDLARAQSQEPLIEEIASLTKQLNEARTALEESQANAQQASADARVARSNSQWAENSVATLEREQLGLRQLLAILGQLLAVPESDTFEAKGLDDQLNIAIESTQEVFQHLKEAEMARDKAHSDCNQFSDQLKALEASTLELETLHRERLSNSQHEASESSARLKDLERQNETLNKGLQQSIEEAMQADEASKQERDAMLRIIDQANDAKNALSDQIAALTERLRSSDEAHHAERCAREDVIQGLCVDKNALQESLNEKTAELMALQQKLVQTAQNSSRFEEALAGKASLVEQQESTLQANEQTIKRLESDLQTRLRELEELQDRSNYFQEKHEQELMSRTIELHSSQQACSELVTQIEQAKAQTAKDATSLANLELDKSNARNEYEKILSQNQSLMSQIHSLESQLQASNAESSTLRADAAQSLEETEQYKNACAESVAEYERQSKMIDELRTTNASLSTASQDLAKENTTLQTRLRSLESNLLSSEAERSDLSNQMTLMREELLNRSKVLLEKDEIYSQTENELRGRIASLEQVDRGQKEDLKEAKTNAQNLELKLSEVNAELERQRVVHQETFALAQTRWVREEEQLKAEMHKTANETAEAQFCNERSITELQNQIDSLHGLQSTLEQELKVVQNQHHTIHKAYQDATSLLNQKDHELQLACQTHDAELSQLKQDLSKATDQVATARQAEARALSKSEKYKAMMDDISSIVLWARSPCNTPRDQTGPRGSFRIAANYGKSGLLNGAQAGMPLSKSQEWNSGNVRAADALSPSKSLGQKQSSGRLTVDVECDQ